MEGQPNNSNTKKLHEANQFLFLLGCNVTTLNFALIKVENRTILRNGIYQYIRVCPVKGTFIPYLPISAALSFEVFKCGLNEVADPFDIIFFHRRR